MARTGFLLCVLLVAACVDRSEGESGRYESPCQGTFAEILRCGIETGGGPPAPTSQPDANPSDLGQFGCGELCAVFVSCGFLPPDGAGSCIEDCRSERPSPEVFDCFNRNGCEAINVCFNQ